MRLSPESRERILANLHSEMQKRIQPRKRPQWKSITGSFVGVAAAVALTVLAGTQTLHLGLFGLPFHGSTSHSATASQLTSQTQPTQQMLQTPQMSLTNSTVSVSPQSTISSPALTGIEMSNVNVGWQLEQNGTLLRTTDGGRTWNAVTPSLNSQSGPAVATVLDSQTAWEAVGVNGSPTSYITLYRTTDGGTTWQSYAMTTPLKNAPGGQVPQGLTFINSQDGWMTTRIVDNGMGGTLPGAVYQTTDGGQTWHLVSTGVAPGQIGFQSLYFISKKIGFTTAAQQAPGVDTGVPDPTTLQLYRTTDGGITWAPVSLQLGAKDGSSVYPPSFFQNGDGVLPVVKHLAANKQTLDLYSTRDFGASWKLTSRFSMAYVHGSAATEFISPRVGFVAWNGWFYSTTDGWRTVQSHPLPVDIGFVNWIHFNSSTHGYILIQAPDTGSGVANLLYETVDGGTSWQTVLPNLWRAH